MQGADKRQKKNDLVLFSSQRQLSKKPSLLTSVYLLSIGGLAGAVSKTAVAPLERVRLLAQTGESRGVIKTSTHIWNHEGFLAFWRGNAANCTRIVPHKATLFFCNDTYKLWCKELFPSRPLMSAFASGSMAGLTATITTYPLDLIRTRMGGKLGKVPHYPSVANAFTTIFRLEGLSGLYRGIVPTMIGAIPYEGIKFGVYDIFKTSVFTQDTIVSKLACGGCAGMIAGFVMYPNDTVRRILQVDAMGKKPEFKGAIDCYLKTFKAHGVGRFYHGVVLYVARMMPNSAIQFGVYETLKHILF